MGLPSPVRRAVKEFTDRIKKELPRMKWVEPENLHITLRFVGEVDEFRVPVIRSAAREASETTGKFDISLGCVGAFPNPRKARILWLGLDDGSRESVFLFSSLEKKLVKAGFEAERKRYHPHITLARLRNPSSLALESFNPPTNLSFSASNFTLYQSTLTPQGPIYEIIEEFELGSG